MVVRSILAVMRVLAVVLIVDLNCSLARHSIGAIVGSEDLLLIRAEEELGLCGKLNEVSDTVYVRLFETFDFNDKASGRPMSPIVCIVAPISGALRGVDGDYGIYIANVEKCVTELILEVAQSVWELAETVDGLVYELNSIVPRRLLFDNEIVLDGLEKNLRDDFGRRIVVDPVHELSLGSIELGLSVGGKFLGNIVRVVLWEALRDHSRACKLSSRYGFARIWVLALRWCLPVALLLAGALWRHNSRLASAGV